MRTIGSVWDHPRPPGVEPSDELVIVTLGGETIAESRRSWPVVRTGRSPVYYVPLQPFTPGPRPRRR